MRVFIVSFYYFIYVFGYLLFDQLNFFVLDVVYLLKIFNVNFGYLVNLS